MYQQAWLWALTFYDVLFNARTVWKVIAGGGGDGSITGLVQTNTEGQSASNSGIDKVSCLLIVKMTAIIAKTAKFKTHVVVRFLMAKYYSAAVIHHEIVTEYGTKIMSISEKVKFICNWFCSFQIF